MNNLFFYDLETSGYSPKYDRIMQFAGQMTDKDFNPVGQPINLLVKLHEDILPSPNAVMVHGITPQRTLQEGLSEPEFLQYLEKNAFKPNVTIVGYNSIRFDDEFMRYTLYRNFYDPYEWQYKEGRSRWDLLDVGRMIRALRPDGIDWPVYADTNQPTNALEQLAIANKIVHESAHDALSDVQATIGLARLFLDKQPKIFKYLQKLRDKNEVLKVISPGKPKPFVYTSGRYPNENLSTTVAVVIGPHPKDSNAMLVYDLRFSPKGFSSLSTDEIKERLFVKREDQDKLTPLPVKKLSINKSPAVAPIGTLDEQAQKRININLKDVIKNYHDLVKDKAFAQRVYDAYSDQEEFSQESDVEGQLYQGFFNDKDKTQIKRVRQAKPEELADMSLDFIDERLPELFFRYKARNYPETLNEHEATKWEEWRAKRLQGKASIGGMDLNKYFSELTELAHKYNKDEKKKFILEELDLYAQSIAPYEY